MNYILPNILCINSTDQDRSFWTRLSHAATRVHFSHLQYLPLVIEGKNLGAYFSTVLNLKRSLTTLFIKEEESLYGDDMEELDIYSTLKDQIGEFQQLEGIKVHYQSKKGFCSLEDLIEKYHHLKSLEVDIPTMETEDHQQQIIACNPRPDITELTCSCKTIINESQMNYVMQKFSGLESIYVSFDPDGGNPLSFQHFSEFLTSYHTKYSNLFVTNCH